jgi:peptidyl-dipeptidase A
MFRYVSSRAWVVALLLALPQVAAAVTQEESLQAGAKAFIDDYTTKFLELFYAANQAEWAANTRIVEGDETNRKASETAQAALANYTGSVGVIDGTRAWLAKKDQLLPIQVKVLESILYRAANNPQTSAELVKERIAAEAAQGEKLYGFDFKIDGRSVSANDIDDLLENAPDLAAKRQAWEASKDVGKGLKDGLENLVRLRNATVGPLGYKNYFDYQVSDYGMSVDEMMTLNRRIVSELWPLYRELHTWARYRLAEKYKQPVPKLLPAHWIPNRWAQEWSSLAKVEGIDLDKVLAEESPEWIVQQAEAFYVSLGFPALPPVFWEKSSLYPAPADAGYKKNNHASAWHLDLERDVRSLMSVQPNERWWNTTHHELGHIYYYLSYTRPEVPPLLREGSNRAFHEAIGSMLGMASMQKPFLVGRGLIGKDVKTDEIQLLLKEALDSVIFMPFSAGTMTHFEHDLYAAGLPKNQYNQRWWHYVETFQGVEPPAKRGEEYCDAASKTHINDDPAQYYDYALSYVILYQIHQHIAEKILKQDPRNTDYFGRKDVGVFLDGLLKSGATGDWRLLMREQLGEEISAKAMLAYFQPLLGWLQEQNKGHKHTLPEKPSFDP